jgi:hypothetical protein
MREAFYSVRVVVKRACLPFKRVIEAVASEEVV